MRLFLFCFLFHLAVASQPLILDNAEAMQTFEGDFLVFSTSQPLDMQMPLIREALSYFLRTPTIIYNLQFTTEDPLDILTGDRGYVQGYLTNPTSISVQNYFITDKVSRTKSLEDQNMTAIIYPVKVCNLPAIDTSKLNLTYLAEYISNCTYGKYKFSGIITSEVTIPCSPPDKYSYDVNLCSSNELYGWLNYANNYAVNTLGIDTQDYKHVMMLLPVGTSCNWAGLGSIGCASHCSTWFNGLSGLDYSVLIHELGHNLGLQHSTKPNNEYGDSSCAMGGCCGNRCFNIPQSYKLGVMTPKYIFTPSNITNNTLILPGSLQDSINFAKIIVPNQTYSYYISFRTPYSSDVNLLPDLQNKVYVHQFATDIYVPYYKPTLLYILSVNTGVVISEINAKVTFVSYTERDAIVLLQSLSPPSSPPLSSKTYILIQSESQPNCTYISTLLLVDNNSIQCTNKSYKANLTTDQIRKIQYVIYNNNAMFTSKANLSCSTSITLVENNKIKFKSGASPATCV